MRWSDWHVQAGGPQKNGGIIDAAVLRFAGSGTAHVDSPT